MDDITDWQYIYSGLQKAAAYTVQQPFHALPFLSGWHMKLSWQLPYQHEPVRKQLLRSVPTLLLSFHRS